MFSYGQCCTCACWELCGHSRRVTNGVRNGHITLDLLHSVSANSQSSDTHHTTSRETLSPDNSLERRDIMIFFVVIFELLNHISIMTSILESCGLLAYFYLWYLEMVS